MGKSVDAFRTISEVAEWLGVPPHVLRFWESKFSQVKPVKRAGGRRYYRPTDMLLLGGIKTLLHDEGMTIKAVQKLLREQGAKHVAARSQSFDYLTGVIDSAGTQDDTAQIVSFARAGQTRDLSAAEDAEEVAEPSRTDLTAEPEPDAMPEEPRAASPDSPEHVPWALDDDDDGDDDMQEPAPDAGSDAEPGIAALSDQPAAPGPTDAEQPIPRQDLGPAVPHPLPLPDLPADPSDDTDAAPGVLGALAALRHRMPAGDAAHLLPYVERLRDLASGAARRD